MSYIEFSGVTKQYKMGEVEINALCGVDFSVEKGEFVIIAGESGAGKSTLIKAILGLLDSYEGEIRFTGIRRSEIGYLAQRSDAQRSFPASVREVVLSGRLGKKRFLSFYNDDDRCMAEDHMRMLGIAELAPRAFSELSGGQQQRVLLARALTSADRMIVLDEPVSFLDAHAQQDFYAVVRHLNTEHGITVLLVSHDTEAALRYCTDVLYLGGEGSFFGSAAAFRRTRYYQRLAVRTDA